MGTLPSRASRVSSHGVLGSLRLRLPVRAVGRRSLGLGKSRGDGARSGASPHPWGPLGMSAAAAAALSTEEHND